MTLDNIKKGMKIVYLRGTEATSSCTKIIRRHQDVQEQMMANKPIGITFNNDTQLMQKAALELRTPLYLNADTQYD